jgi:hypothetical protein
VLWFEVNVLILAMIAISLVLAALSAIVGGRRA